MQAKNVRKVDALDADQVVADPDVPNVDPVVKRDATARVAVLTSVNLVHAADQRDATWAKGRKGSRGHCRRSKNRK